MKTHVSHNDYQFRVLVALVVVSILLLSFGVYKVIEFNHNTNSYTYSERVLGSDLVVSSTLPEAIYSHTYSEEFVETPLVLESWMTDYSEWVSEPTMAVSASTIEMEYEQPLVLEGWMTNMDSWGLESSTVASDMFEESEPSLELEGWMLSDEGWIEEESAITTEPLEEELEVKSWMLELNDWDVPVVTNEQLVNYNTVEEESLELHAWMLNCCTWIPEKFADIDIYEFSEHLNEDALNLEAWMLDDSTWLIEDSFNTEEFPTV
ncbi:hypothetical protein [Labilibacter marinus]|uniref:hypothetical protein n=1 Tax=Labilibacter marinus TaxID=1477105 RepID=UPI00094FCCAA|nr:hypothetical protein [Labilibacter marinus]